MEAREILKAELFTDDAESAYAVIDGAACDELLEQLAQHSPDYCCLYPGELEPDMESVAPYLVTLQPNHSFTEWLLANLPGKPWGILIRSTSTIRQLRKHFRAFLNVKNEVGENLYFRYYDPRVIRIFLPTCDTDQLESFFDPVTEYIAEAEGGAFMAYRFCDGKLQGHILAESPTAYREIN